MNNYRFVRDIPKEQSYEVIVVGGGPAGCASAVCAARNGAKVLLVEACGALGGLSTNGLVSLLDTTCDGERMITGGFMAELLDKMFERGLFEKIYSRDRFVKSLCCYTPFDAEGLKRLLDDILEEAGVDVRFFTQLVDVDAEKSENGFMVRGVILNDVSGLHYAEAKAFIDCTGDGSLAAHCGVPYEAPMTDACPDAMGATLCAHLAGIRWDMPTQDGRPLEGGAAIEKGRQTGMFTYNERMVPGICMNGPYTANMNAGHVFRLDPLSASEVSRSMRLGRQIAWQYAQCYQKYLPGCEDIRIVTTGFLMGIRESRRIQGEKVLTYDDYLARRRFSDQIGIYSKTVDIHPYNTSKDEFERFIRENETERYGIGDVYGIPYGVLVPKGADNLWMAGRLVSCDRKMHGSMRVQPVAYVMGQAAGTAAALSIREKQTARGLNVEQLRDTLFRQGAILS